MTPQTLTPEQVEQIRILKSQGKSLDQIKSYLVGNAMGTSSSVGLEKGEVPTVTENPWQKKSPAESVASYAAETVMDLPQDVAELGRGVQQVGSKFLGNIKDSFTREGISIPSRIAGVPSALVSAGTGLAGEAVVGAARAFAPPSVEQATAQALETGATKVMETPAAQGAVQWFEAQDEQTKYNIQRLMTPAADLVTSVAPVGLFKGVLGKIKGKTELPAVDATPKIQEAFSKAETGDVSDATRIANATMDDATRSKEVGKLAAAYQDSLVGDRTKVNRLLQEQAADMSRGDVAVSQDDLVKALADEGIIPDIRGKLADFTTELQNINKRQDELFKSYEPVLSNSKATASIDDFANYTLRSMGDSPNLRFELGKAEGQLDTILGNLRRSFGVDDTGALTAKQVDEISRQANARSKAYRQTDTFQADVYSELGRAARNWLNDNVPDESFKKVNQEWLRLENLKRTAESMQNQQVDVGILGRALGSYVTTLTGVTLAAGVSNPFTAVAAGILTKMGGDAIADALRSTRFSPEIRAKLRERLTSDKKLIEDLKQTATTQENKNTLDEVMRMLPPGRSDGPRSIIYSGAPIKVTPEGKGVLKKDVGEYSAPGAIKTPTGEGQPIRRGIFPTLSDSEIQQLNTDSFRKILENAGVDAESVKKAVIAGVGGYMLMTYTDEDGMLLPAGLAILSALPNKAKLQALDDALRINAQKRALVKDGSAAAKNLDKANKELVHLKEKESSKTTS